MSPTDQARIVVAGDVSIDWLAWPLPAARETGSGTANWRQSEGTRMVARRGGALLLADLLRQATQRPVIGPRVEGIETISPEEHLHSLVDLELKPAKTGEAPGFRVRRLRGFCGPDGRHPRQPPLDGSAAGTGLVVLDDAGNGFRDTPSAWRTLLDEARPRWLIVKMARPLAAGEMWEAARRGPRGRDGDSDFERLIIVVNADDLRAEGVALSRRLSWERTAEDFVNELGSIGRLDTLVTCALLIVRFDCDGVIYRRGRSAEPPLLYFDPAHGEGECADAQGGRMVGTTAAFTAALAAALAEDPEHGMDAGIRRGMTAARRLLAASFHADAMGAPDYPHALVMTGEPDTGIVALPIPSQSIAGGHAWSILHHTLGDPAAAARRVVIEGPAAATPLVPVAQFGELGTADRREIESFRAIGNLLREYLSVPQKKPISIGVFGPPGAGKSFAVEQVVKHAAGRKLEMLQFNLSQFTALADLIAAFHLVRDCALSAEQPLVFFDEFDCDFDGSRLGWLRYFLAPMQDGTFREGGHAHPLGAAILVFAGGTQPSFAKFAEPMSKPEDSEDRRAFAEVKGPDFASRLRGHVDILGPDPVGASDHTYPIRRGFLLRSLIPRREPMLQSGERLNVDDGVLNALLTVPRYRHGVRSIEALLAMSALTGRTQFERAALPPADQLELHVDADEFVARVHGERLDDALRERIGRQFHEVYREQRQKIAKKERNGEEAIGDDPSMSEWEMLDEELRESNRLQADDIARKLRAIDCFMAPHIAGRPLVDAFSANEIAKLAQLEHERFNAERLQRDWHLGERDIPGRTSPFLVPWGDVPEEWRSLDETAVAAIPSVLAKAGLRIYRVG